MTELNHPAQIFPVLHPLPQILGNPRLRADVLIQIRRDPETNTVFQSLTPQAKEAFLGFCMGERGLKVTYDPFFKHIFDPQLHPGRLDRLLSCILDQKVAVRNVLPQKRRPISEKSALLIMDILVQLTDERLVNVEMQRIGYDFPIERSFCYGADLLVRQYDTVREAQGKAFTYQSIKPIYVIVFMEQSPGTFHSYPNDPVHRSWFHFDTGLEMDSLQNFIFISLDIFRRMTHNNLTELDAWLYFLGSDDPADILRIIRSYPFFQELYQDIVNFRFHPKELISMFSEALRIMDQNTVKYMIDELKTKISQQESVISQKDSEIEKLRAQLAAYERQSQK